MNSNFSIEYLFYYFYILYPKKPDIKKSPLKKQKKRTNLKKKYHN